MSRILIIIVSLIWASLLLVSWGGTTETQTPPASTASLARSAS